jgi:hypothetical protein
MNFYWNVFGPVNLALDLAIAGTFFLFIFLNGRLQPSKHLFTIVRQAGLGAVFLWVLAGLFIGGIIGFSLIARVFWTLFTAALPLVLVFYALRTKKRALLVPALLLLAFKYYGEVFEPNRLEAEHAAIAVKGLRTPVKIAHISDLQTDGLRAMHGEVLNAVNGYEPDFIFFTGDIMNHPSLGPEIKAYLAEFKSRHGSFFVSGNVDQLLNMREFFKCTGFEYLDRDHRKIRIEAGTIGVIGLGLDDFADRKALEDLLAKTGRTNANLLLSHLPDALGTAAGLPVDVLFSGHTHGGQVCLPWFGPLVTMSGVLRGIAAGGIHKIDSLHVAVTRGLGLEGHIAPRVRLFCRPHIFLIELIPG